MDCQQNFAGNKTTRFKLTKEKVEKQKAMGRSKESKSLFCVYFNTNNKKYHKPLKSEKPF